MRFVSPAWVGWFTLSFCMWRAGPTKDIDIDDLYLYMYLQYLCICICICICICPTRQQRQSPDTHPHLR